MRDAVNPREFIYISISLSSKLYQLDKLSNVLNNLTNNYNWMSTLNQLTVEASHISGIVVTVLIGRMQFSILVVGFDQGQLFRMVQGQEAFDSKWLSEYHHDMRHAADFHGREVNEF